MLRGHLRPSLLLLPAIAAVALVSLVACGGGDAAGEGPAATPVVDFASGRYGGLETGSAAPEFAGLGPWLNSDPLTMAGLTSQHRVVLVDFWTYTCVNCVRTLPFLKAWDEKYGDLGLTIVGVHSPEFEFEKDPENVARAVAAEGLDYAVAQDNDWATWHAFNNNVWPAKYLIDANGQVVYRHFGEGDYDETEFAIRSALTQAGYDVNGIPEGGIEAPELDDGTVRITREMYFGYARNYQPQGVYAAQDAYYDGPDTTRTYEDPGPPRDHNVWYAQGEWRNEREGLVHARATTGLEDYVTFRFVARTVNPVLHPAPVEAGDTGDGAYDVVVMLDGFPLAPDEAGPDVTWDEQGRSIVHVDEPRMYQVVALPSLDDRVLRLASDAEGFTLYAVTFGAYTEGP